MIDHLSLNRSLLGRDMLPTADSLLMIKA